MSRLRIRQSSPVRNGASLFLSIPAAMIFVIMNQLALAQGSSPLPVDSATQFHRLTMDQGLPAPNVYCVHQDREGFIWLGTDKGASRFDGLELRTIPLGDYELLLLGHKGEALDRRTRTHMCLSFKELHPDVPR